MATLCVKVRRYNWRFVVLNRNQPIFSVEPLSKKEAIMEKLVRDIAEAREDVRMGRLYTVDQVRRDLGL